MRTFIALELPKDILQTLAQRQKELKELPVPVKWVPPAHFHLTLKFLGETAAADLPVIQKNLEACAGAKIPAGLTQISAFPDAARPQVIWAGLKAKTDALKELREKIETLISPLGYPAEERAFHAHITLGRLKTRQGQKTLKKALMACPPFPKETFTLELLSFFQSTLTPAGPVYQRLHQIILS